MLTAEDKAERVWWAKGCRCDGFGGDTRAGTDPSVFGQGQAEGVDDAIVAEQATAAKRISRTAA